MPPAKVPKYRASCDACKEAKVRCSQTRPSCSRCIKRGNKRCIYGISQRCGKARAGSSQKKCNQSPACVAVDVARDLSCRAPRSMRASQDVFSSDGPISSTRRPIGSLSPTLDGLRPSVPEDDDLLLTSNSSSLFDKDILPQMESTAQSGDLSMTDPLYDDWSFFTDLGNDLVSMPRAAVSEKFPNCHSDDDVSIQETFEWNQNCVSGSLIAGSPSDELSYRRSRSSSISSSSSGFSHCRQSSFGSRSSGQDSLFEGVQPAKSVVNESTGYKGPSGFGLKLNKFSDRSSACSCSDMILPQLSKLPLVVRHRSTADSLDTELMQFQRAVRLALRALACKCAGHNYLSIITISMLIAKIISMFERGCYGKGATQQKLSTKPSTAKMTASCAESSLRGSCGLDLDDKTTHLPGDIDCQVAGEAAWPDYEGSECTWSVDDSDRSPPLLNDEEKGLKQEIWRCQLQQVNDLVVRFQDMVRTRLGKAFEFGCSANAVQDLLSLLESKHCKMVTAQANQERMQEDKQWEVGGQQSWQTEHEGMERQFVKECIVGLGISILDV